MQDLNKVREILAKQPKGVQAHRLIDSGPAGVSDSRNCIEQIRCRGFEKSKPAGRVAGHQSNRLTFRPTRLNENGSCKGRCLVITGDAHQEKGQPEASSLWYSRYVQMNHEELLAYCAGFVDGDGSIHAIVARQGRGDGIYYRGSLAATGKDVRPIKRLVGLLGGSYRQQGDLFQYVIHYGPAAEAVGRLMPFIMGKKKQAQLLLKLQENLSEYRHLAHSQKGVSRGKQRIPDEVHAERRSIIDEMKRLNRIETCTQIDDPIKREAAANAYLAGLVDAEGYFQISRRSNHGDRISLTIQMTDSAVVEWIRDQFKGWVGKDARPTARGKSVYTWRVENFAAVNVLKAISPYLLTKREQADLLILFQNNVTLWAKKLGAVNQFNLPPEVREKRNRWKDRLKAITSCNHKRAAAETKSRHPEMGSDSPVLQDGKLQECSGNVCTSVFQN